MLTLNEWLIALTEGDTDRQASELLESLKYLNNWISNPQLTYDYSHYSDKIDQLQKLIGNPQNRMWFQEISNSYHIIADALARFPKAQNGRRATDRDHQDLQQKIYRPYHSYSMALAEIRKTTFGR